MANQHDSRMPCTPEEVEERRAFVMKQRVRHMYWDDIARAVQAKFGYPISISQVAEDFRVVMRRRAKELAQDTDTLRETMIQQMDRAASAIIDRVDAGNLDATEVYLKIQNRKAKLMGVDMPTQVEDVTRRQRLTADELLAKMAEISKRIKAQRERAGLPPSPPAPDSLPESSSPAESTQPATLALVVSPRPESPGSE